MHKRLNSVELSAKLHSMCSLNSAFDNDIVNVIMVGYMQLLGFYEEHAITALLHFQKTGILVLNFKELNALIPKYLGGEL